MKNLLLLSIIIIAITSCSDSNDKINQTYFADSSDISLDILSTDVEGDETKTDLVPFMPQRPERPYIDKPFMEEYNSNPSIYDENPQEPIHLVDTSRSTYFSYPLKIARRGYYLNREQEEKFIEIPKESGDLISAAYLNERLLMVSGSDIIIHDPLTNTFQNTHNDAITFNFLVQGANVIYILTDKGVGVYDGTEIKLSDDSGIYNIKSAYESRDYLFAASENNIYVFHLPFIVDSAPELAIELLGETLTETKWEQRHSLCF